MRFGSGGIPPLGDKVIHFALRTRHHLVSQGEWRQTNCTFLVRRESSSNQWRLHVKRAVLLLCMISLTTACETSSDPLDGIINGGGGAITPAQASGSWTFTLQRTTTFPCSGALASGQGIAAFINVGSDGTLSGTSSWQNPISGAVEPLSGTVGLSNGALRLTFGTNAGGAMELTSGTMNSGG